MLSPSDHERVREAVAEAESHTSGELFCVLARQTSEYRETPVAWAAGVALLGPPLTMLAGVRPGMFLRLPNDWMAAHASGLDSAVSTALGTYALLQAVLFVVVLGIVSLAPVRRALTPGPLKRHRAHRRALEQFFAKGVHVTRARTGVLIFLALDDRQVQIVADEGIHAKVDQAVWDRAAAAAVAGLREGGPAEGLVRAVAVCGAALAEHFPPDQDNPNELSDELVVI